MNTTATATQYRNVSRVFTAPETHDGDGVDLRRAFPGNALMDIDPFLLLDQLGPTDLAPGEARGFPPHPHRGFETVTYLLSGEMQHRDSWGNHGILRPGDVQWMTAGSGLVHSEMPGETLVRDGGRLHGFQLWVNLPRKEKMSAPRYQDTTSARIPVARGADGAVTAKVIAGETLGTKGVIDTRIPILYLHLTLEPGAEHVQEIPRTENAFAFVISGEGLFGGRPAGGAQVVVFDRGGDAVRIRNSGQKPLSLLLIAGEPIGEPVARYGPFVMNTREELQQAVEDFREGRMGVLSE
ncbi:MAG TPA: pirin family protein [Bryobacteraceae bacterium]|nr:pirin family protein [Bryobacteraceae bacterium]